ncbi:MAG: DUF2096 domain-containing protein [Candidatus Bathyarchaeota archaeon]|nr:DUF2096 domain-containing protein [Candidatus Bathyarchaeota archaeon]
MGYLAVWKVLEEIVVEFRKKGMAVPQHVMSDLKSAKVLISLQDVKRIDSETAAKIEQYLGNVEAYLITAAQKAFSPERVDTWLKRLEEATYDAGETCVKEADSFISGVPRDQKWIRVKPLDSMPLEKLKQIAEESNLSCRVQEGGRLIVYGKAEDIQEFVKKMTAIASRE